MLTKLVGRLQTWHSLWVLCRCIWGNTEKEEMMGVVWFCNSQIESTNPGSNIAGNRPALHPIIHAIAVFGNRGWSPKIDGRKTSFILRGVELLMLSRACGEQLPGFGSCWVVCYMLVKSSVIFSSPARQNISVDWMVFRVFICFICWLIYYILSASHWIWLSPAIRSSESGVKFFLLP